MKIFHPLGGKGVLTSGYAPRGHIFHPGQDLAGPHQSLVYAAYPGKVMISQTGCIAGYTRCGSGLGNHVVLDHFNGYYTLYAHLDSVAVKKGQRLKAGQVLGKQGNTGYSFGSHLHFEIRTNHDYAKKPGSLDPAPYLAGEKFLPSPRRWWFYALGGMILLVISYYLHRKGYFNPIKTQISKWINNNQ